MADSTLQGSLWGTTAHWTNGVPGDGDDAFIASGLGEDVAGATQSGIDLALLRIPEGYAYSVGSSGSFLEIATAKLEHYGAGPLYFSGLSPAAENVDDVEIACANNEVLTQLTSDGSNPADYTRIVLRRGKVQILGALAWDASGLVVVGKIDNDSDVNLEIAAGADTLVRLDQDSGTVTSSRAITTATVSGRATLTQDTAAITTLDVMPGATAIMNYGHTHTAATVIATTVRVHAGATLDLMQNNLYKTITNTFFHPASTVIYDAGLHTFRTGDGYGHDRHTAS
jgi:hypothetical protein